MNKTTVFLIRKSLKYPKKHYSTVKNFQDIPGPKSIPIFGTLYKYLPLIGQYNFEKLHENGLKKYQKYGPIVREEIVPGVHIVWLFKPEDIENLFRYEGKCPQRRSHLALEKYRLDRPNVYNTGGLLPTNGKTWLKLRKVFQKGLSSPAAVFTFLDASNDVVEEWFEQRLELLSLENQVDYLPEISRVFLELICLAALDLRLDSFSALEMGPNSRSTKLMKAALTTNSCILKTDNGPQLWKKFPTPLYKKLEKSQKFMEDVAIDLLSLKMSLYEENKNSAPSLLETYLKSPELDFKDIIGMICDFLLAGIDTTTYTTSFLWYYLAKNPPVQYMLYDEAVKLLPEPKTPVTAETLSQAQYLKATLKESLRLRPISVGIGRVLQEDAVFSNYKVPSGTVVVTQNQVSSNLPEYFPAAWEFKPERWIKSNELFKPVHPFLVLPFGHGPRSCIARRLAEQNIQVLTLKLIRNYKLKWNGGPLDSKSLLINKPDGPINLKFEKRKN